MSGNSLVSSGLNRTSLQHLPVFRKFRVRWSSGRVALQWLMLLWVLMLTSTSLLAQDGAVRAELSVPSIAVDETVTLRVVAIGLDGDLDTTELEQSFDVVGTSMSSQISSVQNGQNNRSETSSLRTWALELQPRTVGQQTVPSVRVGSGSSEPLQLTVTKVPADREKLLFMEASIDEPEPWVQAQVIMTLKVYEGIQIVSGSLLPVTGEHLVIEPLGDESIYQEQRDGRNYKVRERRFAVLPQQSGPLQIDGVTIEVEVPVDPTKARGFFARTRRVTRRTDPIALTVRPRPDGYSDWWLPARSVVFDSTWTQGGTAVAADTANAGATTSVTGRVDEPLTRVLHLQAIGALDSQLPHIDTPDIDGLRIYADEANRDVAAGADGLIAQQDISWAVIPEHSGSFTLPEITVSWFDTASATPQSVSVPAETITVLPAAGGDAGTGEGEDKASGAERDLAGRSPEAVDLAATDEAATDLADSTASGNAPDVPDQAAGLTAGLPPASPSIIAGSASGWRLVAGLAFLAWVLTVAAWVASRFWHRRQSPAVTAVSDEAMTSRQRASRQRLALAGVEASVRDADATRIASTVLAWAEARWPDQPPRSLTAVVARLPADGAARAALLKLDAQLYRPTASSSGSTAASPTASSAASARVDSLANSLADALADLPRSLARDSQALDQAQIPESGHKGELPVF